MLVLSRKPSEKILIGDSIEITIVRIGPNTVRIGIEAPPGVNIRRKELEGNTDRNVCATEKKVIHVACREDQDLDVDAIISGMY